jgi:hypothetical protein
MNENNTWSNVSYEECKPYNIPSSKTLFKEFKNVGKEWVESNNIWCIGCHNTYKLICEDVATIFNIPIVDIDKKLWLEKDLIDIVNSIYKDTKEIDYKTWLEEYEPKMNALIKCINARYFHHSYCYKSPYKNKVSVKSNQGHMRNLNTLCSSLLKLYILYEKKLKEYNDNSKTTKKNLLLDLNTECADNCRNALKGVEVNKILQDLNLKNKDINKIETHSPKSFSSPNRSRKRSSYNVKKTK